MVARREGGSERGGNGEADATGIRDRAEAGTRELILQAAAELFAVQGYTVTTIRQIAERAQMKSGSLYYHFASKDEILLGVMLFALDVTASAVKAAVGALPPEASHRRRIDTAMYAHLSVVHSNVEYTATNVRYHKQIPAAIEQSVQPVREAYTAYWNTLLAEAAKDGAFREEVNISFLRPLLLGMLNRTLDWYHARDGGIEDLFATVRHLTSGIWSEARA